MASAAGHMAKKMGGPLSKVAGKAAESSKNPKNQDVLQKGAKRDPELYVCEFYTPRNCHSLDLDPSCHYDRCIRACGISLRYVMGMFPIASLGSSELNSLS